MKVAPILVAVPILVVAYLAVGAWLDWPLSLRDQIRISNFSGKPIVVTSHHTGESTPVGAGDSAVVPHSTGSILITQQGGATWTYEDLNTMSFRGAPFAEIREYPFPFGACLEVDLVLREDGRVFAVVPDGDNADLSRPAQPSGFSLSPITDN